MDNTDRTGLNHIKGQYGQKYGQEIDDWSALLLSEVEDHFDRMRGNINESIATIDKAASAIQGRHRQIYFSDRKQAFYYALGLALPFSIAGIVLIVFTFWFAANGEEYQRRAGILETFENAEEYVLLMQNGEIIQEQGENYLRLRPKKGKGDVLIGKEYIMDTKSKQILVPLGRKLD